MKNPFSLLTIMALASCLCLLSSETMGQEYEKICYSNGTCEWRPVQRAARAVSSVASGTRQVVRNVAERPVRVVRSGLFGRRVSYHPTSSSYSYSSNSIASSAQSGMVYQEVVVTDAPSPYVSAEAVASLPPTKAVAPSTASAAAACDCCDCDEKLKELEKRIESLEDTRTFAPPLTQQQSSPAPAVAQQQQQQPAEKSSWTAIAAIAIATFPLLTRQA